ncbi:MAG TPA: fasciclin domain-containing protein, partial [Bacteroidales bacterium]
MKINRKISAKAVFGQLSVCILMLIGLIACNYNKKLDLEITPTLNITSYLEENKSTFSELLKLMDREITISGGKTIKYSSFLAAYGSYTLFAPTNEALLSYVHAKKGSDATVDNLTNDEVETLLNFHILQDTISTTSFTDGKLSVPTMTGYYLITGAQNDGGVTHIRVNKQANVVTKNIKLGNGILHVIDGVLEPPQTSTASQIENDPRFSIFTQALKETGYYDTLNIMFNPQISSAARWYSVMATPDLAYIAEGINDYAALKAKYCNTNDPTNPADSLHLYVGYHIMPGLKFVADLVAGNSYNTLTNNQVVSISKDLDSVLINEFTINGVLEKGASVLRDSSDKTTTDGVWHMMGDDYIIKVRKAQPVFLDVCDYPGFRSIPPTWGLPNTITTNINSGQIPGITWAPASTQIA